MGELLGELHEGEIDARDLLQFELKSEFFIHPHLKENIYKQEVFIFVPSPLQINPQTYSKEQFYLDQTTLIRYKTPSISLSDFVNVDYSPSPLNRLHNFLNQSHPDLSSVKASDELKLFGAMFKTAIRKRVENLMKKIQYLKENELNDLITSIHSLCDEISSVCLKFRKLREMIPSDSHSQLIDDFKYIDEFISMTINDYLLVLLNELRSSENSSYAKALPDLKNNDQEICELILGEQHYREEKEMGNPASEEAILYRQGLLNRFVLESLMLNNYRYSLEEKHQHILGAIAAGIAMFVYMILFIWKSPDFGFNSFPFVVLAVFLYILKDRIKEGFKSFYYQKAPYWFPDYSTEIQSHKGFKIGTLKENFSFIQPSQLPQEFSKIRNTYFHEEFKSLQRHESIIHYKKEMILRRPPKHQEERRRELMTIFRFNIHRFLQNASNPFESYLRLDSKTRAISEKWLPKIYHLNLIIRNSYLQDDLQSCIEIKTFRVIVDKEGIKRVEHIQPPLDLFRN